MDFFAEAKTKTVAHRIRKKNLEPAVFAMEFFMRFTGIDLYFYSRGECSIRNPKTGFGLTEAVPEFSEKLIIGKRFLEANSQVQSHVLGRVNIIGSKSMLGSNIEIIDPGIKSFPALVTNAGNGIEH